MLGDNTAALCDKLELSAFDDRDVGKAGPVHRLERGLRLDESRVARLICVSSLFDARLRDNADCGTVWLRPFPRTVLIIQIWREHALRKEFGCYSAEGQKSSLLFCCYSCSGYWRLIG